MDPLSITLSITALLKLTKDVVFYVKDLKDVADERKKFVRETSSLCGMLNPLVEFINDCDPKDPWFQAVRDLASHEGPLDQLSHALQQLKERFKPESGVRKVAHMVGWKYVKEDIASLLTQVERLEILVEIALDLDHFRLSRAVKKELESIRVSITRLHSASANVQNDTSAMQNDIHTRQTAGVLDNICSANYSQQHRDTIAKHHQGTGQWFLEDDKFQTWLNTPDGTLFCPGVPGAGKTIMAALVIEQLLRSVKNPQHPIVFIYCNYKRQTEQSYMHMASTILRQILQVLPKIPHAIYDLSQHTPTLEEITKALHEQLADVQGLTIVIDALDECQRSTRSDLVSLIEEMQRKTQVRFMVTTRDFHAGTSIQLLQAQPVLEVKASPGDLERYIRSRLKYLRVHVPADLQEDLVRGVVIAADGMFLLALLLMDSFQDRMKLRRIKDDLQNLPKGLDAYDKAYSDAMERISGQAQDPKECAERVLSLILCAQSPVSIKDVQHSLMIEPGDSKLDEDNRFAIEEIASVCRTPLHYAAMWRKDRIMYALLQRNADANARDKFGRTPLFYIMWKWPTLPYAGDVKPDDYLESLGRCLRVLCETPDIELDARDYRGHTTLYYARKCLDSIDPTGSADTSITEFNARRAFSGSMRRGHRIRRKTSIQGVPKWLFRDASPLPHELNLTLDNGLNPGPDFSQSDADAEDDLDESEECSSSRSHRQHYGLEDYHRDLIASKCAGPRPDTTQAQLPTPDQSPPSTSASIPTDQVLSDPGMTDRCSSPSPSPQ